MDIWNEYEENLLLLLTLYICPPKSELRKGSFGEDRGQQLVLMSAQREERNFFFVFELSSNKSS